MPSRTTIVCPDMGSLPVPSIRVTLVMATTDALMAIDSCSGHSWAVELATIRRLAMSRVKKRDMWMASGGLGLIEYSKSIRAVATLIPKQSKRPYSTVNFIFMPVSRCSAM